MPFLNWLVCIIRVRKIFYNTSRCNLFKWTWLSCMYVCTIDSRANNGCSVYVHYVGLTDEIDHETLFNIVNSILSEHFHFTNLLICIYVCLYYFVNIALFVPFLYLYLFWLVRNLHMTVFQLLLFKWILTK
jgi:hypothetical protein